MSVEEEFGVKVADEDLENIKTVGDIVNYIEERSVSFHQRQIFFEEVSLEKHP